MSDTFNHKQDAEESWVDDPENDDLLPTGREPFPPGPVERRQYNTLRRFFADVEAKHNIW